MTNAGLTLALSLIAKGKFAPTAVTGTTVASALSRQPYNLAYNLTTGSGSGKVETVTWGTYELAASASNTHDLFAGTVTDLFGTVVAFNLLKFIMVAQIANGDASTAASSIRIGAAASNILGLWFLDTSDIAVVKGTGAVPFLQGDPAGVTVDATHRNVKVLNADGTNKATYVLCCAGEI